jgi:hypothetical protein
MGLLSWKWECIKISSYWMQVTNHKGERGRTWAYSSWNFLEVCTPVVTRHTLNVFPAGRANYIKGHIQLQLTMNTVQLSNFTLCKCAEFTCCSDPAMTQPVSWFLLRYLWFSKKQVPHIHAVNRNKNQNILISTWEEEKKKDAPAHAILSPDHQYKLLLPVVYLVPHCTQWHDWTFRQQYRSFLVKLLLDFIVEYSDEVRTVQCPQDHLA